MTKDDALRMMLGPFKAWRDVPGNEDVVEELTKIINAVEKVLAQPEQEPVAWLSIDSIGERYLCFDKPLDNDPVQPLYTTPPQRKPLTYEQITTISNKGAEGGAEDSIYRFVRAIEAAHGIKEIT